MRILRNGDEQDLQFDNNQLDSISLAKAAMDAQIGIGSMTVPGTVNWVSGDRISVYEGYELLYVGYVGEWSIERNPNAPLETQTVIQLMDCNRNLIGRKVIDWLPSGATTLTLITTFISVYLADMTIDETHIDTGSPITMPDTTYTGDGITDALANAILYSAWTFFLVEKTDTSFYAHWHSLDSGPSSGLTITDVVADQDGITSFAPQSPRKRATSTDLKNNITGRNNLSTVAGMNSGSISVHDAGGLHWQAVLNYGSRTLDDLTIFVNSLLQSAGTEQLTYACSIGPLNGAAAGAVKAGSLINVTSSVMGLSSSDQRISHVTLTLARDQSGMPIADLWYAALELGFPTRLPAASVGLSGQGGYLGALSDPFNLIDHIGLTPDFIPVDGFPVGNSTTVVVTLEDENDGVVPLADVSISLALEMWADDAHTVPGTGWSIADATVTTGPGGTSSTVLTRDTTGTAISVTVTASI